MDPTYLPSTFARSPDPLQAEDFKGEMILISYNLPQEVFEKTPTLDVRLLFKNLTERSFLIPLNRSKGVERVEIVQEEFEQYGSILGYCVTCGKLKVESPVYASMITIDGKTIRP